MKDSGIIPIAIAIGCVIILLAFCWLIESVADTCKWNTGRCQCGGGWVYEQAVGHDWWTSYIYHCDKCGKAIEITTRR